QRLARVGGQADRDRPRPPAQPRVAQGARPGRAAGASVAGEVVARHRGVRVHGRDQYRAAVAHRARVPRPGRRHPGGTVVNERWDAIVVGAGQGGLTCAAYLAVAGGMRVLVLERNAVAGGSAQVFRRRGRYEFDVGTHYIADCGPDGLVRRMYTGLGLDDRISFRQLDPDRIDRIVLPSLTVDMPLGWAAYRERLAAALPAEADGIRRFVDSCARMHAST